MANKKQLEILRQGVGAWNEWKKKHQGEIPDLTEVSLNNKDLSYADFSFVDFRYADLRNAEFFNADLSEADLRNSDLKGANLRNVSLRNADLSHAYLWMADLTHASLKNANLISANLSRTKLANADLRGADLFNANIYDADLKGADLEGADLRNADLKDADLSFAELTNTNLEHALLINTNFKGAILSNCSIYGIAAWDVKLNETKQKDLIITPKDSPVITVDNLEVAQFIYLLLHNEKIRNIIDTITTKVVLILGRFTPKRKVILDAIREELRKRDYIPVLFDFDKSYTRDTQETVTTLAHLAKFVIADITSPRSIPQELVSIVETLPSLPVKPLLMKGRKPWGMFDHIKKYPWVLTIHSYRDLEDLMTTLKEKVIAPIEAKLLELRN